jgi:sugar lactone lactonase YvrE
VRLDGVLPRVVRSGFTFPESLRWHDGRLWVSDHHAHEVIAVDAAGALEVMARPGDMPSGLGWLPDGSLIVACMRTRQIVRVSGGRMSVHADLAAVGSGYLNDLVVDSEGRAYVGYRDGRYGIWREDAKDALVLVHPDGSWRVVLEQITAPNGLVVTADRRRLIAAETHVRRLSSWGIDDDGSLYDGRVFAQLETARPDGICLDADGAVWVAGVERAFTRVAEGGAILDRIEVDGGVAIACALGGEQRKTLYMAITEFDLEELRQLQSPADDAKSRAMGRIEAAEVAVSAAGWP